MVFMRRLLNFMVGGTLLGIVCATLLMPMYLAWDNTPAGGKALCDCAENTRSSTMRLINGQLTGGASGAALGLALGLIFRGKKKLDPPASAPGSAPGMMGPHG